MYVRLSLCLSLRPPFHMEQLGTQMDKFSWNLLFQYFSNICKNCTISLQSDNNEKEFT